MTMTALKPLRPAEHAENQLLDAILNRIYPPGTTLPNERELAEQLGVTRPTLRESLQRLSREGWLTIRHGKPTRVNDYLKEGGLGVLRSLVRFGEDLTEEMVNHLLQVRSTLMPDIAAMAVTRDSQGLLDYLNESGALEDDAQQFADYDWRLQMAMADLSGNPIFRLIMNDFARMYQVLGRSYFQRQEARDYSKAYYFKLKECITDGGDSVERLVRETMLMVIEIRKRSQ